MATTGGRTTGTTPASAVDPRVVRTRAHVMETAADLLREGGVHAVTIEAVVTRSGVARSTIYRHWPTRADVVADAVATLVPPPVPVPEGGSLAERLAAVLQPLAGGHAPGEVPGAIPLLLVEAAREPELAGLRDAFVERVTGGVVEVVRAGVAEGALAPSTDPGESAARLLGPVLFSRFLSPAGADATFVARTVDLFLRSHAVDASGARAAH